MGTMFVVAPPLKCAKDIDLFAKFMHFIMILQDNFETSRAACLVSLQILHLKLQLKISYLRRTFGLLITCHPLTMYWPYLLLLHRLLLLLALLFHGISHIALPSQSSKGFHCKFCCAKGHDISVCRKLQKFLQKQNKGHLPQATAILHIHLRPPHSLQLTLRQQFNMFYLVSSLPFLSPQVFILGFLTMYVPLPFIQLMVLLCLLVIKENFLHLFYPLVTPISFKISSSTCFLLTKFVNYEQIFYLLIMVWMCKILR